MEKPYSKKLSIKVLESLVILVAESTINFIFLSMSESTNSVIGANSLYLRRLMLRSEAIIILLTLPNLFKKLNKIL